MDETNLNLDAALEGVDESKRWALRRLILKGAFVTPIVASVAMSGLTVEAVAVPANTTASGKSISTPSDRRLKTGITRVGTHQAGFGIYRFKYLGSDTEHVGVLAQEVRDVMPHAVVHGDDGFLRVDYAAIDMDLVSYAVWSARTPPAQPTTVV